MKDWKYIFYVVAAAVIFLVVRLLSPKQFDWRITFDPKDKNPYGAYALNELLPGLFPGKKVETSFQTLYEIKDSLNRSGNVIILSSHFTAEDTDVNSLLKHVNNGGSALISSSYFWGPLNDTLGFSVTSDFRFLPGGGDRIDTTYLAFENVHLDTATRYAFRRDNIEHYFHRYDTATMRVIARNEEGRPVSVLVRWGKGTLILNSTPLVFTNINLLGDGSHAFAAKTLSYLPVDDIQWTGFYHVGRMEARTPLRFVLTKESLRWAYFITIISLFLFIIFEVKRKQRVIPIIKPLENTTLEFVSTIGNLYYQNHQHKSIAEKKILFFLEHVRTKYWLSTLKIDASFIGVLSKKSGKSEDQVRKLFDTINTIRSQEQISAAALMDLSEQIEAFNKTT
jgi:hypothetical protein